MPALDLCIYTFSIWPQPCLAITDFESREIGAESDQYSVGLVYKPEREGKL
jgi:hypothetical protein